MRIAIDVSQVIYGTGVSVYTKELVKNLLYLDRHEEYVLCGYSFRRDDELRRFLSSIDVFCEKKVIKLPPSFFEFLWNRVHLVNFEFFFGRCDVYHSSDWAQAPSGAFKVTTVHDVPILYPDYSLAKVVNVFRRRLRWLQSEVDRIIVPSRATRTDLMKLGIDRGKIRVIPEGIGEDVVPASGAAKRLVRRKFNITKKFFLAVGTVPRKNIERVVDAFRKAKRDIDFQLVIVGGDPRAMKLDEDIIFTGFIDKSDLISLYSSSEALIYPSLYEGFGLPILEALKCRTRVVTSRIGALAELGRDHCVLVDPFSVESIRDGMLKVIGKKFNDDRIKNFLKRYSWERTARLTLGVYHEAQSN